MSSSRFTLFWITLVAVAIIGGSRVGCSSSEGSKDSGPADATQDASGQDAGDGGGVADIGIDGGDVVDGSTDAFLDAGMRDATVDIDANFVYEFHPEDAGNPMGSNYEYIGTGGYSCNINEESFSWNQKNDNGFSDGSWYYGDSCWHVMRLNKSWCINTKIISHFKRGLSEYLTRYVYGSTNKIVFTLHYSNPFYSDMYLFDVTENKLSLVDSSNKYGSASHGMNNRELVYIRTTSNGDYHYYKFVYYDSQAHPLLTNKFAFGIQGVNWVENDYLYFRTLEDEWILYDLSKDTSTLPANLQGGLQVDMYDNHISVMGDNSIYRVNYLTGEKKETGFKTGINPVICSSDIMMWVRYQENGDEDVILYDDQTKAIRSITKGISAKFGALCRGFYAVVTPDAGNPVARWYKIDLEKAGFIKDGHVVPESDGGM